MKKLFLTALLLGTILFATNQAQAALVVNDTLDVYTHPTYDIGDYTAIAGSPDSGQGNTGNLLSIATAQNGSLISQSHNMSYLVNILTGGSLTSANILVFGLDINQTGQPNGSNTVDINTLTMTFNNTPLGNLVYNLGSEIIRGAYYGSGASAGEVLFQVNLGFDFLAHYNSTSTDIFSISSKLTGGDDGDERYFLSSGFSANPPVPLAAVPEPASLSLLGLGLLGLMGFKRKRGIKA